MLMEPNQNNFSEKEIIIFLIREELKIRKVVNSICKAGFNTDVSFDMSPLVFFLSGIKDQSDEVYEWYYSLLDRYDSEIDMEDREDLNEKATAIYLKVKARAET